MQKMRLNKLDKGLSHISEIKSLQDIAIAVEKAKNELLVVSPNLEVLGTEAAAMDETIYQFRRQLLKDVYILVVDLYEVGVLSGLGQPKTLTDAKRAIKAIFETGVKHVVVRCGAQLENSREPMSYGIFDSTKIDKKNKQIDLYYDGEEFVFFKHKKSNSYLNNAAFAQMVITKISNGKDVAKSIKMASSQSIK